MKLKQIKLAGFKSFVDPTVLDLRSDLVSVVGPNGCGKSNVIDAVRWVMGESSAKNLRGESITDVIFNGSNTRKPIGQASIELIFDNSDGTIGGEYAAYAEISVRREVNRDAVSNYYLNGTRCRRRDIVEAFLGTGVGSRSYSIIEQGMISRVIESKPEDLRKFVEEAAGISVYKKRRHDTELRMQHTTENLARINDLREEQTKTLEKLRRQAESAKKFKVLSAEKIALESQLLGLRWQTYEQQAQIYVEQLRDLTVAIEEKQAKRTGIHTAAEKTRIEHQAQQDVHDKIQSNFYELGAQLARNEQTLQNYKQRRQQLTQDDQQIKQAITEIGTQKDTDSAALFACEQQLEELNPEYATISQEYNAAEELYQDARLELDNWNDAWEKFQVSMQDPQQQAELQKAKIEHLEQQIKELQTRSDRLQQEANNLQIAELTETVAKFNSQVTDLENSNKDHKLAITDLQKAMAAVRAELQQKQDDLNVVRNRLQQAKGRESALQALQQAALGKDDTKANQWLAEHKLQNSPRLAQSLRVNPGWERAVETVLADYLEAVCIDADVDLLAADLAQLSDTSMTLFNKQQYVAADATAAVQQSLASKLETDLPLDGLLADILVAENLNDALALRKQLTAKQSVITKDGIWLSRTWVRVQRDAHATRGVLEREQALQQLHQELAELGQQARTLEQAIAEANERLHNVEVNLASKQQIERDSSAVLRELSSQLTAGTQKLEHAQQRKQRIAQEIAENKQRAQAFGADATTTRCALEAAIETMASLTTRKDALLASKDRLISREKETKQNAKELRDTWHDLEVSKQTLSTKYAGLQHTISRIDQQLAELHKRDQQIQQGLQEIIEPTTAAQRTLDQLVEQRATVDRDLQQARRDLESLNAQLQAHAQKRLELDQALEQDKEQLNQVRISQQGLEVRKETVTEQLQNANLDLTQVLAGLPAEANEPEWNERVETLNRKLENLGAVNMAADQELETETQRHEYLEVQHKDLQEALTTLENAIKKIDRETKSKFQETFEQINKNFMELFPKLFGGGKAYLEVVGEDLLDAGVAVMAQPPGKKNSTIHLLSGGEKALTAVALVFAIFHLNPAPFCMLDEVDAPLDDNNVHRFGALIKEMSSKVQFVIITHNKATMEIANQLIGVTMKEPGVSRLVSVDINEAVEMALA